MHFGSLWIALRQLCMCALALFSGVAHASLESEPIEPIRSQFRSVAQNPSFQQIKDLNDLAMQGRHEWPLRHPTYAQDIQQVAATLLGLAPNPILDGDLIDFPRKELLYGEILTFFNTFPISLASLSIGPGAAGNLDRLRNLCNLSWALSVFQEKEMRSLVNALDLTYNLNVDRRIRSQLFLNAQLRGNKFIILLYACQLYQGMITVLQQRHPHTSRYRWHLIFWTTGFVLPVLTCVALYKAAFAFAAPYGQWER